MNWLSDLFNLFLPHECHLCGRHLADGERGLCTTCIADLPRTLYHRNSDNVVARRFAGFFPFERASAHFFYTRGGGVARIVHDFKYRKFTELARFMGVLMARELWPTGFLSDIDVVIPVPMHWMKQARRGYNQAYLLACGVAEEAGIEVKRNIKAVKPHKTQTSLSTEERRMNTDHLFAVAKPDELSGLHVLLIDDVCTTGATLRSVAIALHNAVPDARISILALCTP